MDFSVTAFHWSSQSRLKISWIHLFCECKMSYVVKKNDHQGGWAWWCRLGIKIFIRKFLPWYSNFPVMFSGSRSYALIFISSSFTSLFKNREANAYFSCEHSFFTFQLNHRNVCNIPVINLISLSLMSWAKFS